SQQANAVHALAEKLTNSMDAVLIAKCAEEGVKIKGPEAPETFKAAIDRLFYPEWMKGGARPSESAAKPWPLPNLDHDVVTISTSGVQRKGRSEESASKACISIADMGEGQEPTKIPETFMTIIGNDKDGSRTAYKAQIPFAHGTFNMGGSGVYQFCKYQLLITKKHPAMRSEDSRADEWGFTIVRVLETDELKTGVVVEYLAPVEQGNDAKSVLSFKADSLGLMPAADKNGRLQPYERQIEYGTLVKLYEYQVSGTSSNIIINDTDLKRQLEVVLPVLGLPILAADPRYQSKAEQKTPMKGLLRVLDDQCNSSVAKGDDGDYEGPAVTGQLTIEGAEIPWITFVRKRGSADTASNSGFKSLTKKGQQQVILHRNGQNQGAWDKRVHGDAKLDFLARENTIITLVDVSMLPPSKNRQLFGASRDRIKDTEFSDKLRARLVDALNESDVLASYQSAQRQRRARQLTENPKEFVDATRRILRNSDYLRKLLGQGAKIAMGSLEPGIAGARGDQPSEVKLNFTPTYLRHKNGQSHRERDVELGRAVRFQLEIDCVSDYFVRADSPGSLKAELSDAGTLLDLNVGDPKDGALNVSTYLPSEVALGQTLGIRLWIEDELLINPLEATADLKVIAPSDSEGGASERRKGPNQEGDGLGGSKLLASLGLPLIVYRYDPEHPTNRDGAAYQAWDDEWNGKTTAELVLDSETSEFHINIDNQYVNRFKKESRDSYEVAERTYTLSLYILALGAIIQVESESKAEDKSEFDTQDAIMDEVKRLSDLATPTLLEAVRHAGRSEKELTLD
ncbi:hypothetical protein N8943_01850, partial [Aquiluna sp.]|nr:hypothetical protein [Aquiluna sp.]